MAFWAMVHTTAHYVNFIVSLERICNPFHGDSPVIHRALSVVVRLIHAFLT